MPSFNIVKETVVDNSSFRVSSILSNFDLDTSHLKETFSGKIDIEGQEWKVGLIVGGSGTGKSTIAKEVFGNSYFCNFQYDSKAVIDNMPSEKKITEIEKAFTSVGFSSPPQWLRPYAVLSNGEKMRVDLARCLLSDQQLICFDEFTSVVDRDVAKTASYAISKGIKKLEKQFVAVSCHKDIIEWLEPDWIYDTDEKRFFSARVNSSTQKLNLKSLGLVTTVKKKYGNCSANIII